MPILASQTFVNDIPNATFGATSIVGGRQYRRVGNLAISNVITTQSFSIEQVTGNLTIEMRGDGGAPSFDIGDVGGNLQLVIYGQDITGNPLSSGGFQGIATIRSVGGGVTFNNYAYEDSGGSASEIAATFNQTAPLVITLFDLGSDYANKVIVTAPYTSSVTFPGGSSPGGSLEISCTAATTISGALSTGTNTLTLGTVDASNLILNDSYQTTTISATHLTISSITFANAWANTGSQIIVNSASAQAGLADAILASLVTNAATGGTIEINGGGTLSAPGLADKATLEGLGATVTVTP